MLILGIESSCDETAAAVVENGSSLLSNVIASQIDVHGLYGGVVPEIASRKHIEAVMPVILQALDDAGVSLSDIDGIAATRGPGLVGSLLVGLAAAKSIAFACGLPLVGVNHLEGHIAAIFLSDEKPDFPFIALPVLSNPRAQRDVQAVLARQGRNFRKGALGGIRSDRVGLPLQEFQIGLDFFRAGKNPREAALPQSHG